MDSVPIELIGSAVVEWLTFEVGIEERSEWLRVEEFVWSRFLRTCDGFIRKQMWIEEGEPQRIHAVIWWENREKWQAISTETVKTVDTRMGEFWRSCTLRVFDVISDS